MDAIAPFSADGSALLANGGLLPQQLSPLRCSTCDIHAKYGGDRVRPRRSVVARVGQIATYVLGIGAPKAFRLLGLGLLLTAEKRLYRAKLSHEGFSRCDAKILMIEAGGFRTWRDLGTLLDTDNPLGHTPRPVNLDMNGAARLKLRLSRGGAKDAAHS